MSPAPLKIKLAEAERKRLEQLRRANNIPQRVKDRAHMLLLNSQGRSIKDIAAIFSCSEHMVRGAIHRWQKSSGVSSLWDASGRGVKTKLTEEDWVYLEQYLKSESETYSSQQLTQKLEDERQVKISSSTIRRLINKKRKQLIDKKKSS